VSEIRHLRPVTAPVSPSDPDVVSLLELLLERARAGEFNGLAVVTVELVGAGQVVGVGNAYAGQGIRQSVHSALGGVEVLRQRLGAGLVEGWASA
jgi:hypothetical protein